MFEDVSVNSTVNSSPYSISSRASFCRQQPQLQDDDSLSGLPSDYPPPQSVHHSSTGGQQQHAWEGGMSLCVVCGLRGPGPITLLQEQIDEAQTERQRLHYELQELLKSAFDDLSDSDDDNDSDDQQPQSSYCSRVPPQPAGYAGPMDGMSLCPGNFDGYRPNPLLQDLIDEAENERQRLHDIQELMGNAFDDFSDSDYLTDSDDHNDSDDQPQSSDARVGYEEEDDDRHNYSGGQQYQEHRGYFLQANVGEYQDTEPREAVDTRGDGSNFGNLSNRSITPCSDRSNSLITSNYNQLPDDNLNPTGVRLDLGEESYYGAAESNDNERLDNASTGEGFLNDDQLGNFRHLATNGIDNGSIPSVSELQLNFMSAETLHNQL